MTSGKLLVGMSARTSDDPGFTKLLARGLQHGDLSLVHYFDNPVKLSSSIWTLDLQIRLERVWIFNTEKHI
jgi:hypothetical protein